MNAKLIHIRNYFLLISFCFFFYQSKAQTLQMQPYFEIGQNTRPFNLASNGNGEFYYVDSPNGPQELKKLSNTGELSNIIVDNLYFQDPDMHPSFLGTNQMTVDHLDNVYFIDGSSWPYSINKITPDGTKTIYLSDDYYYPTALAADQLGNLYFINKGVYPYTINKIDSNGNISVILNDNIYYVSEIIVDSAGDIYFLDQNTGNSIYKITPEGNISLFFNNENYIYDIKSIAVHSSGNIYMLDQNSYPMAIYKIDSTGTPTLYAECDYDTYGINRIITDVHGNLFLLGRDSSGIYKIYTVIHPDYNCVAPSAPIGNPKTIYPNNSVVATASGIGNLKWYDAIGGNLLATGNTYTTPSLNTATTYFVRSELCNLTSPYSEVVVSLQTPPAGSIYFGNAQTPHGFDLVSYEGFNYSNNTSLLNTSGGTGWTSAWIKSYQDKFFKTSTGFTYNGLITEGFRAEYDYNCYGTCNQIASLERTLPLQSQGIVYFQFISAFEYSGGGGTPSIRLSNGGTLTGGIGASSGTKISLLDASLANVSTSSVELFYEHLVVVRINYNLNKTEMWIDPDLDIFNYLNPTSPTISANFAPKFDKISIYFRPAGSIDEIAVLKQITTINKNGKIDNDVSQTINKNGALGTGNGLNSNGKIISIGN